MTYSQSCHDNETYGVEKLKILRLKNINNIIIGSLNINSLASKFDQLKVILKDYLDILILNETKLGSTFPESQFYLDGFRKPYRFDRNKSGGGVMIYVRKDIPCKQLNEHVFTKNMEAIFVELNFRKRRFLLIGSYHSTNSVHGCSDTEYFSEIEFALDIYSKYDKFLIAGDLNIQEKETPIKNFLNTFKAKNLVKENTCFKNLENPSCIDLFITNSVQSFIHTTTICTGLSDFHKMIVTVLKTTFPKAKSNIIAYRDFSKFSENNFQNDLKRMLRNKQIKEYE